MIRFNTLIMAFTASIILMAVPQRSQAVTLDVGLSQSTNWKITLSDGTSIITNATETLTLTTTGELIKLVVTRIPQPNEISTALRPTRPTTTTHTPITTTIEPGKLTRSEWLYIIGIEPTTWFIGESEIQDYMNNIDDELPLFEARTRRKIIESANHFAANLYQTIAPINRTINVAISPISLFLMLALTAYYIDIGKTLQKDLNLPNKNSVSNKVIIALINEFDFTGGSLTRTFKLCVNNNGSDPVYPAYTDTLMNYFKSDLQYLDFSDKNKTMEILKKKNIHHISQHYLSNAMTILVNDPVMTSNWTADFHKCGEMDFNGDRAHSICSRLSTHYTKLNNINATALELPLQNDGTGTNISMYVLIPIYETGLQTIEENLHKVQFDQIDNTTLKNVSLTMPSFTTLIQTNLTPHLREMNISLFTLNNYDDNIAQPYNMQVTAGGINAPLPINDGNDGDMIELDNKIDVIISNPFIYAIVDKQSGLILYYGRVINRYQRIGI